MIFLLAEAAKTAQPSQFTWVNIAQIVGVVVGVLGSIAFVVAFLRSNLAQSTIKLQSEQITAQSQRIASLEGDVKRAADQLVQQSVEHGVRVKTLEERIAALEASIKTLESLKTGADAVEVLAKDIKQLYQANSDMLEQNTKKLDLLLQKAMNK